MQDPITASVAAALGMSDVEAEQYPQRASRRAAAVLRANGYSRRYCYTAWERGYRWYRAGKDVPERDLCATTLLGIAMVEGHIEQRKAAK